MSLNYQYAHVHNALFTFFEIHSGKVCLDGTLYRKWQHPKWNAQGLKAALEQIKSNATTISAATAHFGIPKTTLRAYLYGFLQKVGAE